MWLAAAPRISLGPRGLPARRGRLRSCAGGVVAAQPPEPRPPAAPPGFTAPGRDRPGSLGSSLTTGMRGREQRIAFENPELVARERVTLTAHDGQLAVFYAPRAGGSRARWRTLAAALQTKALMRRQRRAQVRRWRWPAAITRRSSSHARRRCGTLSVQVRARVSKPKCAPRRAGGPPSLGARVFNPGAAGGYQQRREGVTPSVAQRVLEVLQGGGREVAQPKQRLRQRLPNRPAGRPAAEKDQRVAGGVERSGPSGAPHRGTGARTGRLPSSAARSRPTRPRRCAWPACRRAARRRGGLEVVDGLLGLQRERGEHDRLRQPPPRRPVLGGHHVDAELGGHARSKAVAAGGSGAAIAPSAFGRRIHSQATCAQRHTNARVGRIRRRSDHGVRRFGEHETIGK
jgi:hypothetical protein